MFICVECPSFYCLAPERGKAKNEGWGKRGTGPLSLDVTYLSGGQACNNEGKCNKNGCPPLCLHLCDQKQQSVIIAQIPNIWKLQPLLPYLGAGPPQLLQAVCKLHQKQVHSCLPQAWDWGQVAANVLRVEIDQSEPNLPSKFSCRSFRPSSESRVLNSYVRQILPGQLLSWQRILGERFLMFHALPPSQNPPTGYTVFCALFTWRGSQHITKAISFSCWIHWSLFQ